ncbi:MAG: hypothetical protein D6752_02160, partial [Candidatus Nitrosothermus koennekii]
MKNKINALILSIALVSSIIATIDVLKVEAVSTFTYGDVFVAVGDSKVQWRDATGALKNVIDCSSFVSSTYTTGMAFDISGNLYITMFDGNAVCKVDNTGTPIGTFGSNYNADPESILFDGSGNVYVGHPDGNDDILKFDSSGNLLKQFDVPIESRGSDWIDLAADQCTMYYTSEGTSILRYDVCNDKQLTNFATGLHGPTYALRILPNGNVLVADTRDIHLLDTNGNIIKTYDAFGENCWFALNLDPDGTSFWSADFCTSNVYKFDIDTGAQLLSFNTGTPYKTVFGLAVYGEKTAATVIHLDLEPKTATNNIGTSHTVTATLLNGTTPLQGYTIDFTVSGVNPTSGSDITDADGKATFTYTGNNAGLDTITAETVVDSKTLVGSVSKEWKNTNGGGSSNEELKVQKIVALDDDREDEDAKGIYIDEDISFLHDATLTNAILTDPNSNTYTYDNVPVSLPIKIKFDDPNWNPNLGGISNMIDGIWTLELNITATYEEPITDELKEVKQHITLDFKVDNGRLSFEGDEDQFSFQKKIKMKPNPVPLNAEEVEIEIEEESEPGVQTIFINKLDIIKPSGTVISYNGVPLSNDDSSIGLGVKLPGDPGDWSASGPHPT